MKRLLFALLFILVFAFGLTFAAKNPHTVAIDYYFGVHFEAPVTLVILAAVCSGVALGWVVAVLGRYRRFRRREKELRRAARDSLPQRPAAGALVEKRL